MSTQPLTSKAILIDKGEITLNSFSLRPLEVGEVVIKALYTNVSPGTELRVLGQTDQIADKQYVPGYALVGDVIESADPTLSVGQRVFCGGTQFAGDFETQWGGHCEYAIISGDGCIAVPDGVDPIEASFTALGSIAYHGLTKSKPAKGTKTISLGLGVIGQFASRLHAMQGADVLACDLSPSRVKLAQDAGITALVPEKDMVAELLERMPGGAELLIDSTGVPAVLASGIKLVQDIPWDDSPEPNNRYLVQGSYGGDMAFNYQDAFEKQISFIIPRNRQKQDGEAFLAALAEKRITARDLVVDVLAPADASKAYAALKDPEAAPGTFVFDWTNL